MEKQPIYLDNFELALQMKEAGFDKECAHEADFYSEHYNIVWNKSHVERYRYHGCVFDVLQLPTLGEIDLPEYISIVREQKSYYVYCNNNLLLQEILNTELPNKNTFTTELEARAHAWIWANQKKEVKNEK
jgi:hypothetical protein